MQLQAASGARKTSRGCYQPVLSCLNFTFSDGHIGRSSMKGRVLMNSNENVLALFLQIQKAYLKCCYDAVKDEPIKMTEMIRIL